MISRTARIKKLDRKLLGGPLRKGGLKTLYHKTAADADMGTALP